MVSIHGIVIIAGNKYLNHCHGLNCNKIVGSASHFFMVDKVLSLMAVSFPIA